MMRGSNLEVYSHHHFRPRSSSISFPAFEGIFKDLDLDFYVYVLLD